MSTLQSKIRGMVPVILSGILLISCVSPAYADQFDDQINAIQQQISGQQAQINRLRSEKNTLENKIAGLNAQIDQAVAQLNLSIAKLEKVVAELTAAEAKLVEKKQLLAENVRAIYKQKQITPIEALASSSSIGEFLNHQSYLEQLQKTTRDTVNEISALKAKLEKQRKEQSQLVADQKVIRLGLQSQRDEVAQILADTQGQEDLYQQQVASNNSRISQLRAQQAAAIAANSSHVGGAGCGGYPAIWCNSPQDSMVDSWGMYNRECVSYAAWAVSQRFGRHMPYWGGRGNANQWPANADAAGIPRDNNPRVGDVAIYMGGYYGHAMIVEEVRGSTVLVSSFNADNTGRYSLDVWSRSALTFIHF